MREESVVEDAVERNSGGKSRCEQMCRFPNTGGLHRTSGGAPLETPTLRDPVPVWCHVHKSNSSSSMRTQVAAVAYKQIPHQPAKHSTSMGYYQPPHLLVLTSVYGIFYFHLNFFCVLLNVSPFHGLCFYRRLRQPGFALMMKNWIYVRDTTPELDPVK